MKSIPTQFKSAKKAVLACLLVMILSGTYGQANIFFQYPPVLVPDSIYVNIDSSYVNVNVYNVWNTTGGIGNIYANAVSLADTNFFQYLGSVSLDSIDSINSKMHVYRFIYTGYQGSITSGDIAFIDLSLVYNGQQQSDMSALYNPCAPNNNCPSHLDMQMLAGALASGFPYSAYANQYSAMPAYNQQVMTTLLNWIFINNAPTVTDYLNMLDPNNLFVAATPAVFCTGGTIPGCVAQRELYDTMQSISAALVANGPDNFDGFTAISNNAQNTFTFHCFMSNLYNVALFSASDVQYTVLAMPLSANYPLVVSIVRFDTDTAYSTTAYSYNMAANLTDIHETGGVWVYGAGWHVANGDSAFRPFPVTLPTITANGPISFCSGGYIALTASDTLNHLHWSTGDTLRTIVSVR